jgi:hypothetical protein
MGFASILRRPDHRKDSVLVQEPAVRTKETLAGSGSKRKAPTSSVGPPHLLSAPRVLMSLLLKSRYGEESAPSDMAEHHGHYLYPPAGGVIFLDMESSFRRETTTKVTTTSAFAALR